MICHPCQERIAAELRTLAAALDRDSSVDVLPSTFRVVCPAGREGDGVQLYVVGNPLVSPWDDLDAHELGKLVRAWRKAMDHTQLELALKIGVTQPGLSMWEKGDRRAPAVAIYTLLASANVTVSEFLAGPES